MLGQQPRLKPACACLRCTGGVCIMVGGPDRVIVDARGRRWRFEDHPRFGPVIVDRKGDPKSAQPGERSPFWDAYEAWRAGGKRVDDAGLCAWQPPAPEPLPVWLGGGNYAPAGSALAKRYGRERKA
jgi:hypothetical protein